MKFAFQKNLKSVSTRMQAQTAYAGIGTSPARSFPGSPSLNKLVDSGMKLYEIDPPQRSRTVQRRTLKFSFYTEQTRGVNLSSGYRAGQILEA